MPEHPDPPPPVLAGLPSYAVRSLTWSALAVIGAAVCLALGWHDEQAWARMSAVTLTTLAAVAIGVTVVCLRQDALRRDIVGLTAKVTLIDDDTVDLTNTTATLSAEVEALKAFMGDFIKRYPPVPRETARPIARRRHGRRRPRLVQVDESPPGADNVIPMPPESTRKALDNIRRKINGDSSGD